MAANRQIRDFNMQLTLDSLPDFREATRMLADVITPQMLRYLEMTKNSYRPAAAFGPLVAGGQKEGPKDGRTNFDQFKLGIKEATTTAPFAKQVQVNDGVEIAFGTPELTPFSYSASIETKSGVKTISVKRPLKLIISLPGFPPSRLEELARMKAPPAEEVNSYVLQYTALNFLLMRAKSVIEFSAALGFPITTLRVPEFGALPLTVIETKAGTVRPPDSVVAQIIHYSGATSIDEIVDVEEWQKQSGLMSDAFHTASSMLREAPSVAA